MNERRPRRDDDREERITMEIIVDAYNESEVCTGWYCYLENTLAFPFEAECVKSRNVSPLKPGERVTVLGMLDDDEGDGLGEMMVEVEWRDCTLGIPLAQIKGIGVDEKTSEAIADWHYWVAQGRQF
jgi:Calcium binding